MSEEFLSQEEIDALLNSHITPDTENSPETFEEQQGNPHEDEQQLTPEEIDVIGEVGNISMGSAATTMSDLVQNRVSITTPRIQITTIRELFASFVKPYVVVDINYTEGLTGSNLFLISQNDALIIADLMMGGSGTVAGKELSEMELSAVSEAMNQMMGSAATAMSNMFGFSVIISPPQATAMNLKMEEYGTEISDDIVAVVSFRLEVGDLIDSQIMQVIPLKAAKEMVSHLLSPAPSPGSTGEAEAVDLPQSEEGKDVPQPQPIMGEPDFSGADLRQPAAQQPAAESPKNLDLILDVPLKVSVILGRCKKPIGEVLKLVPGTIVELDSLANEPVDILVNGTLIAQGEVVVVNENFGIQVKNIISPQERLQRLRY